MVADGPALDQLTDDTLNVALSHLTETLKVRTLQMQKVRNAFLFRFAACVQAGTSVPQCLRLLKALIAPMSNSALTASSHTRSEIIGEINAKHDLLAAIVRGAVDFQAEHGVAPVADDAAAAGGGGGGAGGDSDAALSAGAPLRRTPSRTKSSSATPGSGARTASLNRTPSLVRAPSMARAASAPMGRMPALGHSPSQYGRASAADTWALFEQYRGQLRARLDFITFLCSNSALTVPVEAAAQLWEAFALRATSDEEREMFYAWFASAADACRGSGPLEQVLAPGVASHLFERYVAKVYSEGAAADGGDGPALSKAGFDCVRRLFLHMNAEAGVVVDGDVVPEEPKAEAEAEAETTGDETDQAKTKEGDKDAEATDTTTTEAAAGADTTAEDAAGDTTAADAAAAQADNNGEADDANNSSDKPDTPQVAEGDAFHPSDDAAAAAHQAMREQLLGKEAAARGGTRSQSSGAATGSGSGSASGGGGGGFAINASPKTGPAFKQYRIVNFEALKGLDVLWAIAVGATDDSVATAATSLLNELLVRLAPTLVDSVDSYRARYIPLVMARLAAARSAHDTKTVERCLGMLNGLLDESEMQGLCGLRSHAHRSRGPLVTLVATEKPSGFESRLQRFLAIHHAIMGTATPEQQQGRIDVTMHVNDTVFELREALAAEVGCPVNELSVFTAQGTPVSIADNGRVLAEIGLSDPPQIQYREAMKDANEFAPLMAARGPTKAFKAAIEELWAKYKNDRNTMTVDDVIAYFKSCEVEASSWERPRVQLVIARFHNVRNPTTGDYEMTEQGFHGFYISAATDREDAVWNDLVAHGWRTDMRKRSDVLAEDIEKRARRKSLQGSIVTLLPRYVLSHDEKHFALLFSLLDEPDAPGVVAAAWDLLMRLPTNPARYEAMLRLAGTSRVAPGAPLDTAAAGSWRALLDPSSPCRLLYSLIVVEALVEQPHHPASSGGGGGSSSISTTTVKKSNTTAAAQGAAGSSVGAGAGAGAGATEEEVAEEAAEAAVVGAAEEAKPLDAAAQADLAAHRSWCHRFLRRGGFQHILQVMLQLTDASRNDNGAVANLELKSTALLLKVMRYFVLGAMSVSRPDMLRVVKLGMHEAASEAFTSSMRGLARSTSEDAGEGAAAAAAAAVDGATAAPAQRKPRSVSGQGVELERAGPPRPDMLLSLVRQLSDDETFAAHLLKMIDFGSLQTRLLRVVRQAAEGITGDTSSTLVQTATETVSGASALWVACLLFRPELYSQVVASGDLFPSDDAARSGTSSSDLLTTLLRQCEAAPVRRAFSDALLRLVRHFAVDTSGVSAAGAGAGDVGSDDIVPLPHLLGVLAAQLPSVIAVTDLETTKRTTQFFDLLGSLAEIASSSSSGSDVAGVAPAQRQLASLWTSAVGYLRSRPVLERDTTTSGTPGRSVDGVLTDLLRLLATLARASPEVRAAAAAEEVGDSLMQFVFQKVLFARPVTVPGQDAPSFPLAKSTPSRNAAYSLLLALCDADGGDESSASAAQGAEAAATDDAVAADSLRRLVALVASLESQVRGGGRKKGKQSKKGDEKKQQEAAASSAEGDASKAEAEAAAMAAQDKEAAPPLEDATPLPKLSLSNPPALRSPAGFVGLRNLGATCYMNSLVQQM